jgi:hypothetical protein
MREAVCILARIRPGAVQFKEVLPRALLRLKVSACDLLSHLQYSSLGLMKQIVVVADPLPGDLLNLFLSQAVTSAHELLRLPPPPSFPLLSYLAANQGN